MYVAVAVSFFKDQLKTPAGQWLDHWGTVENKGDQQMYSYLLRGASLLDGSGSPPCRADVAVAGSRIAAVGPDLDGTAERVIDAGGLVLSPGFIDIHGHSDMTLFRHPLLESKLFQGITTEVIGNCGLGLFPVRVGSEGELSDYLGLHDFILPEEGFIWNDEAGLMAHLNSNLIIK